MKNIISIILLIIFLIINILNVFGAILDSDANLVKYYSFDNTLTSTGVCGDALLIRSNSTPMDYEPSSNCKVGTCVTTTNESFLMVDDMNNCTRTSTPFTISAMVKSDYIGTFSEGPIGGRVYPMSYGTTVYRINNMEIREAFKSVTLYFDDTNPNYYGLDNGTYGVANVWEHWLFRYSGVINGGTGEWFKNGIPIGRTESTPTLVWNGPNTSMFIGVVWGLVYPYTATTSFDEWTYWNRSLSDEDVLALNASYGRPTVSNTVPSLNINSPDNDTITNVANVEIIFNASDSDSNPLDCHLFEGSTPIQSIYTINQVVNQSLNTTLIIEQEHIFSIICDDGIVNTTEYLTIIYDTENPSIEINNPYQNNTYYENDYYYNISINDTNLYSSNITIYCNNIPYYENVTQDYNLSQIDLIDLIFISTYGNNSCDLCARICDGHTNNQINLDYTYKNNELMINNKNEKILFTGDIKDIIIKEINDKISYIINLNTKANVIIRISKEFKKVSKTNYYGHFINLQKELWIDTNPFEISYYYYDKDYLYIVIIPQTTSLNFNSIGELNCINECRQFNIDTDYPYIIAQSPLEADNYNSPINLSFTFIASDSMDIANCSLYLNDTLNYTITEIIKDINQSMYIYFNIGNNNESYYYNISCSDYNAHIGFFENINFNINYLNTSTPPSEPEPEFLDETALSIDKFGKWIITLILIIIWTLFLILSIIFGGNWFLIMTGFLGIGIGIYHNFNGFELLRYIFIAFNIMIIAFATLYYNAGIFTK